MIYTSYFDNIGCLPDDAVTISICLKPPEWYTGPEYKKLAPEKQFFDVWQLSRDNEYYIRNFNSLVLNELDATAVFNELNKIGESYVSKLPGQDARHKDYRIVLLCYEKPDEFCHRHLVSEWLNDNGIPAEEIKTQQA